MKLYYSRLLCFNVLSGALCAATWIAPAAAQQIAHLYAPQAPAGSAYVRVVNATAASVPVAFAGGRDSLDPGHKIATDYRVVDAAAEVTIKASERAPERIRVKPGTFSTVVLNGDAKSPVITDITDGRNDLKAELRFYNLARDCEASLSIQDGARIFDKVAYGASVKRDINPVQARLTGRCDNAAAASAPVPLPQLKPGGHASLFLIGDGKTSRLIAQADATETYSGAR
jgi:alginate O-acetyltransferase complex protein AlgF